MRRPHLPFLLLFVSTLVTAAGYGATFLLTDLFQAIGGSELQTGWALAGATVGTFAGVPVVGWLSQRFGAACLAALGGVSIAAGLFGVSLVSTFGPAIPAFGFLVGLGWGAFYLATPLALSGMVSDKERGFWFTWLGAFQMAGIGGGPIATSFLIDGLGLTVAHAFRIVAGACLLAAVLVAVFHLVAGAQATAGMPDRRGAWVRTIMPLSRSLSIYPIIMVMLGACVFGSVLTFQTSIAAAAGLNRSLFFGTYTLTVVAARFLLAPAVSRARPDSAAIVLLAVMAAGVAITMVQGSSLVLYVAGAVALGVGYGLVYSVIQTQAVNDAAPEHRHAALTWFVLSYFLGVFGFSVVGSWIVVRLGTRALLATLLLIALGELALAIMRQMTRRARGPAMGTVAQ